MGELGAAGDLLEERGRADLAALVRTLDWVAANPGAGLSGFFGLAAAELDEAGQPGMATTVRAAALAFFATRDPWGEARLGAHVGEAVTLRRPQPTLEGPDDTGPPTAGPDIDHGEVMVLRHEVLTEEVPPWLPGDPVRHAYLGSRFAIRDAAGREFDYRAGEVAESPDARGIAFRIVPDDGPPVRFRVDRGVYRGPAMVPS